MKSANNKSLNQFFLLVIIFILPVVISWILYHYHHRFPLKTLNYGTLVKPPVDVKNSLATADKKWQVVFVPDGCCDASCEKTMFTLHQLRRALGKESGRVALTLVIPQTCSFTNIHDFQKMSLTKGLLSQLQNASGRAQQKIYLVDPIGNLFMYYPNTVDPMDVLKDLKLVLEVSQIG
jgi:hypothetical protein